MKKHKHCELIKAWADGTEIEQRYQTNDSNNSWSPWHEFDGHWEFTGTWEMEYRIKPEPKADVVISHNLSAQQNSRDEWFIMCNIEKDNNVQFVFDGETGKLKSVKVLK